MNYGKIAYLKTIDLEQRVGSEKNETNNFECSEFSVDNYNETFYDSHMLSYPIKVLANKSVCLQSKIVISCTQEEEIEIKVLAGDGEMGSFSQKLTVGENDIIVYKSYISDMSQDIDLKIQITGEYHEKTILRVNTLIFGIAAQGSVDNIEMRVLSTSTQMIVSFINSGKIFISKTDNDKLYENLSFEYYKDATSHCFVDAGSAVKLYYVNAENVLKECDYDGSNERIVAENVTKVFAIKAPDSSDDDVVVCYLSDSKPKYKCLIDGVYTPERNLPFPDGSYSDIRLISDGENFVYAIATKTNGANFIIKSVMEISTGKLVENVSVSLSHVINKYYCLPQIEDMSLASVSANVVIAASTYYTYASLSSKVFTSNVRVSLNHDAVAYQMEIPEPIEDEITYGITINMTNSDPKASVTYTNDAVGMSGAYMDFDNDTFVDNGWLNKWPFNKIKPCILSSVGEVAGYLDPNDYTKLTDGTSVDISVNGNYDVMIEIPKIYYDIKTVDKDHITVQISNGSTETNCCRAFQHKGEEFDKIYVAAYHSFMQSDDKFVTTTVRSVTGGKPPKAYIGLTKNLTQTQMINFIHERGGYYESFPYDVYILIECLYLIMFKSLNTSGSIGHGYKGDTLVNTGTLDKKGMFYGTTGNTQMKIFGIEDLYGNGGCLLTGVQIDKNMEMYVLDPTTTVPVSYDPGIQNMELVYTSEATFSDKRIRRAHGSNKTGIIITETAEMGENEYFSDTQSFVKYMQNYRTCGYKMDTKLGLFSIHSSYDSKYDMEGFCRMVYYKRS